MPRDYACELRGALDAAGPLPDRPASPPRPPLCDWSGFERPRPVSSIAAASTLGASATLRLVRLQEPHAVSVRARHMHTRSGRTLAERERHSPAPVQPRLKGPPLAQHTLPPVLHTPRQRGTVRPRAYRTASVDEHN